MRSHVVQVDVSYDSKWVLATTAKYLMVVKTQFRDKNGRRDPDQSYPCDFQHPGITFPPACRVLNGHRPKTSVLDVSFQQCCFVQGNQWLPGEDGAAGAGAATAAPQGRGPGQGQHANFASHSVFVENSRLPVYHLVECDVSSRQGHAPDGPCCMGRPANAAQEFVTWHLYMLQVGRAALQKGKFTWITESGRQERWIVASCGAYTVLWNFRFVFHPNLAALQCFFRPKCSDPIVHRACMPYWCKLTCVSRVCKTVRHFACVCCNRTNRTIALTGAVTCAATRVEFCTCRQVKLADSAVQSYGGLTTVTEYHLIPRQEDVVDSTFMHDNYASPGAGYVS